MKPEGRARRGGIVKRHDSLISLSQEAGKPIFHLKANDGAIGSHAKAARDAQRDFEALARKIAAASWNPPDIGHGTHRPR